MRPHRWLIPAAALIAAIALALHGPSCGKDFRFHLQSWLDVAAQLRHRTYPRWNFLSAYNAGEPRYLFYPPISWLLGGLLTLLLPFTWVAPALAFCALTLAGFSFRRLASRWVSPSAAVLAACFYLANPFFFFSIDQRAAYGEIFVAAALPLLLEALLSAQPTILGLALPLAFIWLSNVPGGVIAAYLFTVLALLRLIWTAARSRLILPLLWTYSGGALLAIALDAFYLLPAAVQRPFIHADEPFKFPLRPTDSLFFSRPLQPGPDDFLIRIAHLALLMAIATFALLGAHWLLPRRNPRGRIALLAAAATAAVCLMLTEPSRPLWHALPGLYILQFPWRLLMLLAICMAIALAVALRRAQLPLGLATTIALLGVASLSAVSAQLYCQPCQTQETPLATRNELLIAHRAPEPIDEYVIAGADQEMMRPDNPPFWLADDPLAYPPNTMPDPPRSVPLASTPATAQPGATPLDITVHAPRDRFLIVNLQAYPRWRIQYNGRPIAPGPTRPDGLLTIPLDAGTAHITLSWHHGWDEWTGATISILALILSAWLATKQQSRV